MNEVVATEWWSDNQGRPETAGPSRRSAEPELTTVELPDPPAPPPSWTGREAGGRPPAWAAGNRDQPTLVLRQPFEAPLEPVTQALSRGARHARPAAAPRARAVFAVVCAAVFLSNLDLFVVNVAFPDIHRALGGQLSTLSWVLNGYAIVFAALMVPAGRLADRHGHRAGFLFGLGLFTAASAACAASPGLGTLIVARTAQAVGAAALIPTSLALLLAVTPPERRPAAVRGWAAVGGLAAALGPVVGGLLVEADWRWVFLINVPFGVVALVAALRVLPRRRPEVSGAFPDALGVLLLTFGVGLLALGLVQASSWGWTSAKVVGSFTVAALFLAGLVVRSARHPAPVVELSVLRAPGFGPAVCALLLFSVAFAAMLLSIVAYLDAAWGWSPLLVGLALAPGPAMVPPVALALTGRLVGRFGAGAVAAVGTLAFAAGPAWWAWRTGLPHDYATAMLPGLLIVGFGVGLALPTLTAAATSALPADRFATGSAVVNMSRQIGGVLGVAILIAVIGSPSARTVVGAFHAGWWFCAAASLAATAVAALGLMARRPARGPA
ncbi:DHA2 family efflux MFS transporter permease subunit [Frankia sp. AgB1.9]|uniref:DHA2 family efflux MFS transporter permease subunit n=2 Tax=unclassified Frankia TaxID=2632575 RepID=UPI001931B8E9|nr:DHA2 family efflux MFS transporter permease subunit [Frankia sp. AgB1.9]MBL7553850.1 DHA2 family efflux MFS transporter permease subunit [Frankia sp. AgB1.9]